MCGRVDRTTHCVDSGVGEVDMSHDIECESVSPVMVEVVSEIGRAIIIKRRDHVKCLVGLESRRQCSSVRYPTLPMGCPWLSDLIRCARLLRAAG